ncbi:hypothetical protein P5V90_09575 [Mycobacteroides abscessus subsp. abscessus]|nr:hypothetical protein [Mycobacteroides abscessus]MDO3167203.1 hypothetical protein [Mycobacteroides abscessus subsp. abscessus]
MPENTSTPACSACDRPNEVLVRLVDALMTMGVDFEIHQTAA